MRIRSDSKLVVDQINGACGCNSDSLVKYLREARRLMDAVSVTIAWVPREQNQRADTLSRLAYREHTGREAPDRAAVRRQRALYDFNRKRAA